MGIKIISLSLVIIFFRIFSLLDFDRVAVDPFQLTEKSSVEPFGDLIDSLVKEGFPRPYLERLFQDQRVEFVPQPVGFNLIQRESTDVYRGFLVPYSIVFGKLFFTRYKDLLTQVAQRYQVDPGVMVAILRVESGFGRNTGQHRVFNVFASLTQANSPHNLYLYTKQLERQYTDLGSAGLKELKDRIRSRAKRKAKWALNELVHLLRISQQQGVDPLSLKGSWAGAFGIPQFIPSSYLKFAVDGDGDGRVDLYNIHDAIASVANYLREAGFRQDAGEGEKKTAIWKYNHSQAYVDCIWAYAKKLN